MSLKYNLFFLPNILLIISFANLIKKLIKWTCIFLWILSKSFDEWNFFFFFLELFFSTFLPLLWYNFVLKLFFLGVSLFPFELDISNSLVESLVELNSILELLIKYIESFKFFSSPSFKSNIGVSNISFISSKVIF